PKSITRIVWLSNIGAHLLRLKLFEKILLMSGFLCLCLTVPILNSSVQTMPIDTFFIAIAIRVAASVSIALLAHDLAIKPFDHFLDFVGHVAAHGHFAAVCFVILVFLGIIRTKDNDGSSAVAVYVIGDQTPGPAISIGKGMD